MKFLKVNLIATLSLSSMLLMGCCSGSAKEDNIVNIENNTTDDNITSTVSVEDSNSSEISALDNTTIPPKVDINSSSIKMPPSIPS